MIEPRIPFPVPPFLKNKAMGKAITTVPIELKRPIFREKNRESIDSLVCNITFQFSKVNTDFPVILKRPKLCARVRKIEDPINNRMNPTPGKSIRISMGEIPFSFIFYLLKILKASSGILNSMTSPVMSFLDSSIWARILFP